MTTTNSRPLIYTPKSVVDILARRKTVTRRVDEAGKDKCPYGSPGDLIWVKEPWAVAKYIKELGDWVLDGIVELDSYKVRPPDDFDERYFPVYKADGFQVTGEEKWRSPYFMPRWASRVTLEITGTRRERLHDITDEGAVAEGYEPSPLAGHWSYGKYAATARDSFSYGWDAINGKRGYGWETNPPVWVIEFKLFRN